MIQDEAGLTDIPYDLLMQIQTGTLDYTYKGYPTLKNPFDLALYSKLIWQAKPRSVLEIGSNAGGSAIWLADQCRMFDLDTHIWSVDIEPVTDITYDGVTFQHGDGRDLHGIWPRSFLESLPRPLMVIEDADHSYETTIAVLRYLAPIMEKDEWIVVEDGILKAMKVEELYNGGPSKAICEFMDEFGEQWEIDRSYCDFFGKNVTWNTDGFLRRLD